MEDKKHKHHHHEEEHHHHRHHHHECPPIGNPDCEGHTKGERVLTESGLKAILQKLTGRLMLAVGVVKAKGDAPLKLWKDVDGDGILIRGLMTPVSESTDGWFSKEDYQKFLQALEDIETIFKRLANIDATLEGLAGSITSIRAELKEIQTHLTTLDGEITAINTRIDELTTLVNNLDTRVTELNKFIEGVQNTLGDCVNKIEASGDDCLTLSPSKSGQTATVTGSVKSATTTQRGAMTATDKSRLDELWQKYQNGDFGCDCTHYTYGDISVSLSYSTASASATSLSPSMSYSQTVTGSDGSTTTLTSGATVVYSLSNAASGVTINSSTGVLSFSANTSTSQRTLGTVTVSVTMNEKTTSRSVTVYQSGAEDTGGDTGDVTYEYSTPSVRLSYDTALAKDTTLSPTLTYSQTKTGSDGSSTSITSGGTVVYTLSNAASGVSINSSSGVLSFPENTGDEDISLGTVTVTVTLNGETGTATRTPTQDAPPIADPDSNVECIDYMTMLAFRSVERGPFAEEGDALTIHTSSSGGYMYVFDISGYSKVDIYASSIPNMMHVVPFVAQDTLYDLRTLYNMGDEILGPVTVQKPWSCNGYANQFGSVEGEEDGFYINGEVSSDVRPDGSNGYEVTDIATNGKKYLYVVRSYGGAAGVHMPRVYAHN